MAQILPIRFQEHLQVKFVQIRRCWVTEGSNFNKTLLGIVSLAG